MSDDASSIHSSLIDWTADPSTPGRSNSSPEFLRLIGLVGQILRNSMQDLIAGRSDIVARVVLARLAHDEHLMPAHYKGVRVLSVEDDGEGKVGGVMSLNDEILRFTAQPLTPEEPGDTRS